MVSQYKNLGKFRVTPDHARHVQLSSRVVEGSGMDNKITGVCKQLFFGVYLTFGNLKGIFFSLLQCTQEAVN